MLWSKISGNSLQDEPLQSSSRGSLSSTGWNSGFPRNSYCLCYGCYCTPLLSISKVCRSYYVNSKCYTMDIVIILKPQGHYYIRCMYSYSMNITSILKSNYHISLICHSKDIILVLKVTNKPLGHFQKLKFAYHFRIKINIVVNTKILLITQKN